ncbi:MAG TPA: hypothetical protein VHB25_07320, partial [Gemmatimonadaceae bacterium]|nr:hypothetical protein [Gemmatimonadaceae bacterium]
MAQSSYGALARIAARGSLALALGALVAPTTAHAQRQQGAVRALGVDTANFDRQIRPQDDF